MKSFAKISKENIEKEREKSNTLSLEVSDESFTVEVLALSVKWSNRRKGNHNMKRDNMFEDRV